MDFKPRPRMMTLGALLLSVLAGGLATRMLTHRSAPRADSADHTRLSEPLPVQEEPSGAWQAGTAREYMIDFSATQSGGFIPGAVPTNSPPPMMGVFKVKGRLLVTADRVTESETVLRLAFSQVESAEGLAGQQPLGDDSAEAMQGEAWVVFREAARDVRLKRDVGPRASALLELLAYEFPPLTFSEGSLRERTAWGNTTSNYQRKAPGQWKRSRASYEELFAVPEPQSLRVTSQTTIGTRGEALVTLNHRETIDASSAQRSIQINETLTLSLVAETRNAPILEVPERNELDREELAAANLLETRINGLTESEFLSYLGNLSVTAGDLADMLWRMGGLLRQHPEIAYKMKPIFFKPSTNHDQKSAILDILAQTGHKEAQEVLQDILRTPDTKRSPGYTQYLQRLSFVAEPNADTVRFVENERRRSTGSTFEAWGYVEGAIVGRLARTGYPDEAERINRRLISDLGRSEPSQEADRIKAIGNAGLPQNNRVIASHAKSPSPATRRAVAIALLHVPSEENESVLLALAQDTDATVRIAALGILAEWDVSETRMAAIATLIESNKIPGDSFGPVLGMAQKALRTLPEAVVSLVTLMVAKEIPSQDTRTGLLALQRQAQERTAN